MTRARDLVDIMGGGKDRAPQSRFGDDDTSSVKSDLHDFDLAFHYDTGKAVLVSETGEEAKAVWLPKAHVEIVRHDKTITGTRKNGQTAAFPLVTVTCPQWLAQEKGLI
jgi:hypothetical protein